MGWREGMRKRAMERRENRGIERSFRVCSEREVEKERVGGMREMEREVETVRNGEGREIAGGIQRSYGV